MIKISAKSLGFYLYMAAFSLLIKIPFAVYKYYEGFLHRDFNLISPDGYSYVQKAKEGFEDIRLGSHWVYELLNDFFYHYIIGGDGLFFFMSLLNIVVATLLPLVALIFIESQMLEPKKKNRQFRLLSALLLFWPSSIWLGTENLKDTFVALLFLLTTGFFFKFNSCKGAKFKIGYAVCCLLAVYILFSLRSYLAVIFLIAAGAYLLFYRPKLYKFLIAGVAIIAFLYSPLGAAAIELERNFADWLFNPDALEALNKVNQEIGAPEYKVNYGIVSIFIELIKLIFGPLVGVYFANVHEFLQILRTFIINCSLFYFLSCFMKLKFNFKVFFGVIIGVTLLFYSIVPSYSGPRQLYGSFDMCFLYLLSFFLIVNFNKRILYRSLMIGLLISVVSIVFTLKGVGK